MASHHVIGYDSDDWMLVDGKGANDMATNQAALKHAYMEFFFLTDPYQFIYTHFPGMIIVVVI